MEPILVLEYLDRYFNSDPQMLRIFNSRTNKTVYELHKGFNNYLFKSDFGIDIFDKPRTIKLLNDLKELVKKSNFLKMEFSKE